MKFENNKDWPISRRHNNEFKSILKSIIAWLYEKYDIGKILVPMF